MRRDEEDVFAPTPLAPFDDGEVGLPAPGPTQDWSSRGVIEALEPMVTDERRARLLEVLDGRLNAVTVVMDNPHDPHNGSAVLRSCDAFGVSRVHVLTEREEFLASRVVALGSQRWVDVVRHDRPESVLQTLRRDGYHVVTTHPQGRLGLSDLSSLTRVALVLGNERDGVSEALTEGADDSIAIPMRGFVESLNVSVSAAILVQAATQGRLGDLSPPAHQNIYARWLRNTVPRADQVLDALEAR